MKKKVLFVNSSLCGGGSERVMTILANEMCKNHEYDVNMALVREKTKEIYKLDEKINCIRFMYKTKNKILIAVKRIYNLRKIIKNNEYDSIISFMNDINIETIIACLGLKKNLIISERNDPKKIKKIKWILMNLTYNFANVLVCQTDDAKRCFSKKIQKKTVIIPNPVKNDLPIPWEGKREKTIVNFCRLVKQKNLILLIKAFDLLHIAYPEYKLLIYGEGNEKTKILNYINEKNLQNCVEIRHTDNNVHEKVLKSTMFVSSSDYEGISNSMLEAMAIGLPVVCTDCPCGGAKMIIENNKNGILVPVNDAEEIHKAMKKIIEDEDFSKKISNEARKIKESLSQSKICEEWIKLL